MITLPTAPVTLVLAPTELFFDIEVGPMCDLYYLHGFVERTNGDNATERYVALFTKYVTAAEEARAFAEAWASIQARQPSRSRISRRCSIPQDRLSCTMTL